MPHRREEAEARALDAIAEEPLAHRAARLLLHHEGQARGAAVEVDHGVGAGPAIPGTVTSANWPASKSRGSSRSTSKAATSCVSRRYARTTPARARGAGGARLARLQGHADLERAIVVGHALAHQEIGRALEIPAPRGLRPLALGASAHQPGPARAAGARAALVGQLDAAPEAGVEDLLPGVALEVVRAVPGLDDDLHADRPGRAPLPVRRRRAASAYRGITSVANSSMDRMAWSWLRSPHWKEQTK